MCSSTIRYDNQQLVTSKIQEQTTTSNQQLTTKNQKATNRQLTKSIVNQQTATGN